MIRPLRLLAVDMGIANAGLATTHDQLGEPRLSCRTITPRKRPSTTLMDHWRAKETIDAIISATGYRPGLTVWRKPDLVLIESPINADGTGDVPIRLAEIHGAVKHWVFAHGIPYVDVHLTKPKIYAVDHGGAKKPDVLAAVIAQYGSLLSVGSYDAADATSMLFMGLDYYGSQVMSPQGVWVDIPPVPDRHRRALAGVEWPALGIGAA